MAAALAVAPLAIGAAGDLDRTFGGDGKVLTHVGGDDYAFDVAVQRDGKVVVVGESRAEPLEPDSFTFVVARYTSSGTLDRTFGGSGIIRLDGIGSGSAVAMQTDGKIVVAGSGKPAGPGDPDLSDFALARLNPDGSLDVSFGGVGRVFTDFGFEDEAFGLAIQPDGRIVAVGWARSPLARGAFDFALARYNRDGSLDPTFDGDGRVMTAFTRVADAATDVVVQSNEKIVVGGYSGRVSLVSSDDPDFALARYNADGSLDSGFGGDGRVTTRPGTFGADIALQANGKILLAGRWIRRYNRNGTLDPTFGRGKPVRPRMTLSALEVQPDRKIIAVGQKNGDFAITRLGPTGSADQTFGRGRPITTDISGGTHDAVFALALQPNRRIVVAGYAVSRGLDSDFAVARYLNPASPPCIVPNVRGKTLRAARRAVARRHCAVGRVTHHMSHVKKGLVIRQSHRPGLRLPAGARVNLVVSKGRS